MGKPSFYMQYIAADAIRKALDKIGAQYGSIDLQSDGAVRVGLDGWYVDMAETWWGEEWLTGKREERERVIVAFLDAMPGSVADRIGNRIEMSGEVHGVKYLFQVGEALCERVEVGQKEVTKVDPAYLADAPVVTVTEPVYEWRCSDDIMGSMAHKEVAA